MFGLSPCGMPDFEEEYRTLEDYQGPQPRWCSGCGDNAVLAAVQRLCRDEQLPPERTVFVSGIGCASRLPHYMKTYGFHGLHGRALPIAEGVKIKRPDLHVFVTMGDGDCCSIGTAHWIHAVRMNMDMVALLHDNSIYGLTKMQASPTTPRGMKTKTSPYGSCLDAIHPISTTLGITNASFVAQVVDWIPDLLFDVVRQAFHHKGFAFVRIIQRCPHFLPDFHEPLLKNPENLLLLRHEKGMRIPEALGRVYKSQEEHDPGDLARARTLADRTDKVPVGILYRRDDVGRYEEAIDPRKRNTPELIRRVLEEEFETFAVHPQPGG